MSLLLLALAGPAAASSQLLWSYDAFGTPVSGHDSWKGGYSADTWSAFDYGGHTWAYPNTDEGDGTFLQDAPASNWMVNPAVPVKDGEFLFDAYISDDDAIGGVVATSSTAAWMVVICGNQRGSSCPVERHAGDVVLLQITSSGTTELDSAHDTYPTGQIFDIHISSNDGVLRAWSEATGWEVTGAIADGTAMSSMGFYAYNCGGMGERSANCAFSQPMLYGLDDDNDNVIDDQDNCEFASNADQSDRDGDGIGDACDSSTDTGGGNGGGDADTDTDTDSDTDADSDTDTDTDADTDSGSLDSDVGANIPGEIKTAGSCGCASSPSGGAAGLLGALGLAVVARRRRSA